MQRYVWLLALIAVFLVASEARADHGEARINGTITSIRSSTIWVRADDGRTYRIVVQDSTDIQGARRGNGPSWDNKGRRRLRVGDRVRVDTFRLDDGRYLATTIQVRGSGSGSPNPYDGDGITIEGIVVRLNGATLTVQGPLGMNTVLVTSETDLVGRANRISEIRINDYVRIQTSFQGMVLVARSIEFPSRWGGYGNNGQQVQGRIVDVNWGRREFRLDNGVQVRVSNETRFERNGRSIGFNDLREGMVVRVVIQPISGSNDVQGLVVAVEDR